MLLMVIGFLVFFFMVVGGVKKVRKITRKVKKKVRKTAIWLKRQEAFKRNWFYEI